MCIRDEDGVFALAKTILILIMHVINVGEAMSLYYVLEWLSGMWFDNVDFVLDSKLTRDAFNHHRPYFTEFGQIIIACRRRFSSYFTNSKVEFNQQQTNEVAHTLVGVGTYQLVSPFILMYLFVLNILLLMKCYKHLLLK